MSQPCILTSFPLDSHGPGWFLNLYSQPGDFMNHLKIRCSGKTYGIRYPICCCLSGAQIHSLKPRIDYKVCKDLGKKPKTKD